MSTILSFSFRKRVALTGYRTAFTFLLVILCLQSSAVYAQKKTAAKTSTAQQAAPKLTYAIINSANNTYGYDLYADGKLRIHQPAVPAMPGNEGFKTREAAEKVAKLAIQKMSKGESLPTISPDELKKLKAL